MKYLWSEDSKLNEDFKAYSFGIKQDWCLIDFEWKLQLAQVEFLYNADILGSKERDVLNEAILTLSKEFQLKNMENAPKESDGFEDIHSFVEFKICEIAGGLGKKIHTGRSRNDQVATLIKLYLDHKIEEVISLLTNLCENLSSLAEQYEKKPMPITTHFQQAALGSVDHYLEMRKKSFWVVREDLMDLRKRIMNECPLGSGACVGSSINLDRNILSKELGFDRPSTNSLYSTSSRDEVLDFSFSISKLSLNLQNFISELIIWSNQNFSWVKLPKEFCTGSSMMPNKLNPDSLELLRCDLKKLMMWPNILLSQLSSLPSGYSRDFQIIKDDCFQNVNDICKLMTIFNSFIEKLEFNTESIEQSLNYGFIDATLEMEKMVKNGIPLREAHNHIARNVQGKLKGSFCNGEFDKALNLYRTIGSPIK